MKYVFGPVPSRRLGQSLGVDTIPLKTCNWNCVYCQLGRTHPLIHERRDYFPPDAILAEIHQALESHQPSEIDWITFVGSGEPTLCASIGQLIEQVKATTDKPVALITNGSYLCDPLLRQSVAMADAVLPTLDAGSERLYLRINRPHRSATFERLVTGMIALRKIFTGRLWVEVMLVHSMNDTEPALLDLVNTLQRIEPDEIHINLPMRPPAEAWVQPPAAADMLRAAEILGRVAHVLLPAEGRFDLSGYDDPAAAVLSIISRHPMREQEIIRTVQQTSPGSEEAVLLELERNPHAQLIERYGIRFWGVPPDRASGNQDVPAGEQLS